MAAKGPLAFLVAAAAAGLGGAVPKLAKLTVASPAAGCPATRAKGGLNCFPEASAALDPAGGCAARGCCYDAGAKFCYPKYGESGQCPYNANANVNCHPEPGADKKSCEARGCCWDDKQPKSKVWCYPKGPSVSSPAIKLKGAGAKASAEKTWGKHKGKVDYATMPTAAPGAAEKLVTLEYQRACMLVEMDPAASSVVSNVADDVWGIYSLQYQSFNKMPVYRQHTYMCDKKAYVAGKRGSRDLSCTNTHFSGKKKPYWMYYDSQQRRWMVGKNIGAKNVHVLSAISFASAPDLVAKGSWEASKLVSGELMVKKMDSIATTCLKNPKQSHGRSDKLPTHEMSAADDSKCFKFRKTAGCDPDGPRAPEQDKTCSQTVGAELSGYCDCASGIKMKVACGHKPFKCADECTIKFPHVLAQSGERTWTNQVARNLVKDTGDWLSSQTKAQWVIFDLGLAPKVVAVKFNMWGSSANPKNVMLESSTSFQGPWTVTKRVVLPEGVKQYLTHIDSSSQRYWRLFIKDNWGAQWGVGFNAIRFLSTLTPTKQPDPCHTFKTKDACVYLSVTSSNMNSIGNGQSCGWCAQSKTCVAGTPENPVSPQTCSGDWLWNSLTTPVADPCHQFSNDCDSCTNQLSCGFCQSSNDCRSNYCKVWAGRSCGNSPQAKQLKVAEQKEAGKVAIQYKVLVGLLAAGGLLVIPTAILAKKRGDYWKRRAGMKDQDAQWDQEAANVIEVGSYQSEEAGGLLPGGEPSCAIAADDV